MNRFGSKNSLAVFISLLVLASLACSLTNSVFQPAASKTPKAAASKTALKVSPTPLRKASPTRHLPPAFIKLTASAAGESQDNSNNPETITPLPGPTEEIGYEVQQATATEPESNSSTKSTSTRTLTPVPGTPFTPTSTVKTLLTATMTTVPSATSTKQSTCGSTYNHQYESDLLDWINEERQGQGMGALTRNKLLDKAALRHSLDMACTEDWFDQKGSDGSTLYDRIVDAGYDYLRADQTIYAASGVSDSPKSAFDTWKSLPTSKSILFDSGFTDIGIGYVNSPSSTYGGYFTAVFAVP